MDALSDSATTDDALGVADCEPIDNPTIEATPEVAILGDNAVLVAPLAFREAVGADQMLADWACDCGLADNVETGTPDEVTPIIGLREAASIEESKMDIVGVAVETLLISASSDNLKLQA